MARSKSSAAWLNEHVHDHWVQRAKKEGYRARAAFKLLEINDKDQLIRPNLNIVDLGAAPGSWSQVVAQIQQGRGKIIALDILPMEAMEHVQFIQGDFREESVLNQLLMALDGAAVDLVLSDMAPNLSGNKSIDQARAADLLYLALEFAQNHLNPGGHFLIKVFQGSDFAPFLHEMRQTFREVLSRKPKASRDRSSEIYLLGKFKK